MLKIEIEIKDCLGFFYQDNMNPVSSAQCVPNESLLKKLHKGVSNRSNSLTRFNKKLFSVLKFLYIQKLGFSL